MFPLKIHEILMGYSGQCLQKQPSIGNLQKKGRSSHQSYFIKKGVLRNFKKFTGKHLCQSLFFNKVAGLKPETLLKKRLWQQCFPMNFVKFLRTPFLRDTSRQLLLEWFSKKIGTIRGKTSVLEFPFFSVSLIFKKRDSSQGIFLQIFKNF